MESITEGPAILFNYWKIGVVGIMILFVFFSAILSLLKKSLEEIGKSDYEEMKERGRTYDLMAMKLFKSDEISLIGLFIGVQLLNVFVVLLGLLLISDLNCFSWLLAVGVVLGTIMVEVVFCERIPQYLADRNPRKFLTCWVWVAYICLLFLWVLAWFVNIVTRRFKLENPTNALSEKDLSEVIEIAEGGEEVKKETDMLKGIVRFGDLIVSDIMISRMDILAVPSSYTIDQIIRIANESGFSRIPVYEESIDNIKGILYVKDLLPHIVSSEIDDWNKWIRPCFFVHEHKVVRDLLKTFQEDKIHLAVVVDEYGGTAGLVTLEDIIEEIVGEITDEYDKTKNLYEQTAENTYSFEGKTSLLDFCKVLGLTDDSIFDDIRGDSETLAGLILETIGEIPEEGQEIKIKNFSFYIEKCNKRRIERIRILVENEV